MKMMVRYILTLLLINICLLEGFAQNLSNKGKDFWVGYGHHQFMEPGQNNSQEMVLYFSAEQTANVVVTVKGRTATQVTNYNVPAGTVIASNYMPKAGTLDCRLFDVPPSFGGNGGEGIFNMSIHIESDVPIVAYSHTFGNASSGATMLMPVETYGYTYFSINSKQNYQPNCFSWAYAIATHDNTVVEVTPSVTTRLNKLPGVPVTVTLNKGQIFQVIAGPEGASAKNELSGTKFKSIANTSGECWPIAVFSGSSRTSNPISCGSGGGDNDNQQCFPTQAWGKRYLTAPTSRSTVANQFMMNSYKVLVKDPTTIVTRNGIALTGLQQNSYYFFESTTADYIVADKPVMVAQFMTGGVNCIGPAPNVGDPEMIYISPIEQGIKRIGFYRNNREAIQVNYLTLIIPNNGVSSLRIDGSPAFDHSYVHPQLSGYTVVVKRWTAAQAQAIVSSDSAFTAITYGLGSVESYGYNAGTLINNLNAVSSIQNVPDPSAPQHPFTCQGTPVNLSVLMAYQPTRLEWLLSQLGTAITPNTDVIVPSPVSSGTVLVNGITYYKYTLPGTYVFNVPDTNYIPINGFHPTIENCYNRENFFVPVIVKATPIPTFTFSHSGCTLDTVYFSGQGSTTNGYTISNYNWTFPGPATATGQNVNRLLAPGIHNINLSVVTTDGCSADTTRQITVYDKPPANFMVSPLAACVGNSFTLTDTSTATIAVNQWYWDFGNGVTQLSAGPTVSYTYPLAGTYTIKHVSKSSLTCMSDTVTRVVTVYAKPTVSFTNNANGCLTPAGLVQFTGNASSIDGQTITGYAWNFGDPNATTGNPNTSTLQNPSHNFQQGSYNVNFSATTGNGCTKDTTMTLVFNLKPALAFTPIAAVCENAAAFAITGASVTNGVTGNGVYTGPGINASGLFDPAIAGYGSHTIWYKFTTAANCVDSISQTILVHARPRTSFSIPNSGCLAVGGAVQFTNTSTIPDAQTMSWLWNFNDPNATTGNPNTATAQNPTHNFQQGTYSINLSATSSNGCMKDTTITATFNLTPALTFGALADVCQNSSASPSSIASAIVTNGVTGNGVYSGPGIINANGLFDPNIAGAGTHTITYTFTSAAGCAATTTSTIRVFPQPLSDFTISNVNVCLGQSIVFTAAASTNISNWNWNFGGSNTLVQSAYLPPTISYTSAGTYNVILVTTSTNGCISQPTTKIVTVSPIPNADFSLPSTVCMPGGAANFVNGSTISDNSSLNYSWDFGDTFTSTVINPSHNYSAPGSYPVKLTVTSTAGCTAQITKTMSAFADKPVANFNVAKELCQGQNSVFTDASTTSTGTIQSRTWNFGDATSSTSTNPVKLYSSPGIYNVSLTVTNNAGCVSDPFIVPVTVHLQPVIDAGTSLVVAEGSIITLNATANSTGLTFAWSPSFGLSSASVLNPQLTALSDQVYTLTATGAFGCTATDDVSIKILKKVKVPNVFSPNGDNIHDQWLIPNLSDYPGSTVEVFNRYGQRVFYSAGYGTPWDGNFNGKPLPAGAYYYVIELKNGFKPITGSLTILR
jgi:gliding motility-associated-like protein